jgi:K+-transporting ATPase ATPase B chain
MHEIRAKFIPFSAYTRLSGIDTETSAIRKGAVGAIFAYVRSVIDATVTDNPGVAVRSSVSVVTVRALNASADKVAKSGGTPLAVAKDGHLLGIIHLKDIIKGGIKERFSELRQMGIRTVMITGDNPLTAAAIAARRGSTIFSPRRRQGKAEAHSR